jgi:phage baseplate assembly protein W
MGDISHEWGCDLSIGPTGDLGLVTTEQKCRQRILRRLLTSVGGYIWHLNYGSGLGQFVGSPIESPKISGIIRNQMRLEKSVSRSPEPKVGISSSAVANSVYVNIAYNMNASTDTQVLNISLS